MVFPPGAGFDSPEPEPAAKELSMPAGVTRRGRLRVPVCAPSIPE